MNVGKISREKEREAEAGSYINGIEPWCGARFLAIGGIAKETRANTVGIHVNVGVGGANGTETEGSQTGVDAAAILYDCLSDSMQLYVGVAYSVSIGASTEIRHSGWLRTNKRTFIYSRISAAESRLVLNQYQIQPLQPC